LRLTLNLAVRAALRDACIALKIQPVLCGSALHGAGVQPLLDGVGSYLPCPIDRPAVTGIDPKKPEKILERKPNAKEPFCGLVFKVLPAKTGDMFWIRVYSGRLDSNSIRNTFLLTPKNHDTSCLAHRPNNCPSSSW
jgi:elongation factor G